MTFSLEMPARDTSAWRMRGGGKDSTNGRRSGAAAYVDIDGLWRIFEGSEGGDSPVAVGGGIKDERPAAVRRCAELVEPRLSGRGCQPDVGGVEQDAARTRQRFPRQLHEVEREKVQAAGDRHCCWTPDRQVDTFLAVSVLVVGKPPEVLDRYGDDARLVASTGALQRRERIARRA